MPWSRLGAAKHEQVSRHNHRIVFNSVGEGAV
jgi:hypothetical protein